ncbi:phosphate ABC transporter permease subunit PstC [Candidatus Pelagibacter sp. HIMB109]|uniref:phosphate ABC transporter permease subunit PstC n=1 Tax=Candidatus Pelagibacter sp. HIMB109 TaxID=3415412 RepID=UPI003F838151
MNLVLFLFILLFSVSLYFFSKSRIGYFASSKQFKLKALPKYYAYYLSLWCALPALIILVSWNILEPAIIKNLIFSKIQTDSLKAISKDELNLIYQKIKAYYTGNFSGQLDESIKLGAEQYKRLLSVATSSKVVVFLSAIILFSGLALKNISNNVHAREGVEKIIRIILFTSSVAAILTTVGIIFSLLFESIKFFTTINFFDFIFGTSWSPQKAFVSDASAELTTAQLKELSEAFGAIPLFAGTAFIAFIAMCVAVPIGLFSGIYFAEYAGTNVRKFGKPIIEILAGVPTVVYGFFAALTVGPFFRILGESLGLEVSSESALAAGLVMGVMIIPFVSSLTDDVVNAVPQSLRDGSYAVGATKSETIKKVVFPAALPGIVGSILLAVSRAIGETMIVVMAAGLAANLTINPLESTTTVTTQIVMILVGDQEFTSAKTQAAFALGLTLFAATLVLNFIALRVVKKYREQYE